MLSHVSIAKHKHIDLGNLNKIKIKNYENLYLEYE